jgi:hypothetical protein
MSDEALIPFGKYAKKLCGIRVGGAGDPYKRDSEEARREWRRRYPSVANEYRVRNGS